MDSVLIALKTVLQTVVTALVFHVNNQNGVPKV